jgi:hypothetical protein
MNFHEEDYRLKTFCSFATPAAVHSFASFRQADVNFIHSAVSEEALRSNEREEFE